MRLIKHIDNLKLAFQVDIMVSVGNSCEFKGHWADISKKYLVLKEPATIEIELTELGNWISKKIPEGKLHNDVAWGRL